MEFEKVINNTVNDMPWWVGAVERLGLVTMLLIGVGWIAKDTIPLVINGHVQFLNESVNQFKAQTAIMNDQSKTLSDISMSNKEQVSELSSMHNSVKDNGKVLIENQQLIKNIKPQ